MVSVPIDAHGKKLRWRKEPPDEQGWWCLENNCVKVYQVVVDTCSKDIKIYGVDNINPAKIKDFDNAKWVGPICLPID